MQLISKDLIDHLSKEAKMNERLRINFNFHEDLADKCQRLLNALQPGTIMPIHHHKVDEVFIILQGSLNVLTYNDDKQIIESITLKQSEGTFGVNIPAGTWHSIKVLEKDTVIFEVKEGPYIPHSIGGTLE